jgi:hypothetical protein
MLKSLDFGFGPKIGSGQKNMEEVMMSLCQPQFGSLLCFFSPSYAFAITMKTFPGAGNIVFWSQKCRAKTSQTSFPGQSADV